jgi:hypothetical protein
MRYLFQPELELLMEDAGLQAERFVGWLTDDPMSCASWSSLLLGRKPA